MYIDFAAGGKEYKLRLTTRNVVALEKQLGCNPIMIFGKGDTIPTVSNMVAVLHASLQAYQHKITLEDAYGIFDDYLADGNNFTDFMQIILDIYTTSGLIKIDEEETEKN